MMKLSPIALLLASAAFAAAQSTCDDVMQKAADACGENIKDEMATCFSGCVEDRNSDFIREAKIPPCPELADLLCSCGEMCLTKVDAVPEGCKELSEIALNCNLAEDFNCEGHTCPEASTWKAGDEL